jgi:hypothetical protein
VQGCKLPSRPVLKVRASEVIGNPLANLYRVSEIIGNPLTNSQKVLATFASSTYLPEGCQHPLIFGQRVLITLQSNFQRILDNLNRHLQEGCPSNKERGNLFAIPLKKLKVKIKIQEVTDSFKNYKRFIF